MRENGAGCQNLDVVGTKMREFAHNSADLPRTVGNAVAKSKGSWISLASPVIAPAPSLIVTYAPATYMRGPMNIPLAMASRMATSLKAR